MPLEVPSTNILNWFKVDVTFILLLKSDIAKEVMSTTLRNHMDFQRQKLLTHP